MAKVLFETDHYMVTQLSTPITFDDGPQQASTPLNYAIRNKNVDDTVETYASFLPMAINIAKNLTDEMINVTTPEEAEVAGDSEESNVTSIKA